MNNYFICFVNSETKGIEIRLEYRYERSFLYSMIKMKKKNSEHFSKFFNMHVYYYFSLRVSYFFLCVCVCVYHYFLFFTKIHIFFNFPQYNSKIVPFNERSCYPKGTVLYYTKFIIVLFQITPYILFSSFP